MKLLFDQNLSYQIVENLVVLYPGSSHVRMAGFDEADDETIWNFARDNDYAIISKDADFHQRSFVRGFPPKVIWVRCGNSSTSQIEKLLKENYTAIQNFCDDPVYSFLIIG
ncbi:MAG TPA: DUF5615 family PIN-like protein [Terriglobia bacterium]|nr:DUF5615 family PIN-like protein [Terriglobia bacterium]